MRGMRYVFADIVRVHHETLRRIAVEAQISPSFSTGAPKHEKLRFSTEIDGFVHASCWMQAEYFCRSWKCVHESPKHCQKWSPQSTLTFSMERQTLQKHFWTWSIFEWPSPWWLVLSASDVPYTDVYNTSPRRYFTAYSLGDPCAHSFCTRAPKCQNLRFRSQTDGFLWTNYYA